MDGIDRAVAAAVAERAPRIRVVYTDLDGTMLGPGGSFVHGPDRQLTAEPAEALLAAHAAGIDVVPVSGRAVRGLVGDARLLGMTTVVAEMGALVAYDTGREVVQNFGETPPGRDGEMPMAIMERTGAIRLLLDRYAGRLEYHTPWSAWRECTALLRGRVDPKEADATLEEEGHGWLTLVDNGRLHRAVGDIPQGQARAYHLCPRGVSKGAAIALDRKRRGLALEETMLVGDSIADCTAAPEVGTMVVVRDAAEANPELAELAATHDNVVISSRPMNLGWADAIAAALPPSD